jgi:hypothetical protein
MMDDNEPDLAAVRGLAADVAGPAPTADAVARTWSRVTTAKRRRIRWARMLVPAGAAVAVLAVLVTTIALRPGPGAPQGGIQIGAQPVTSPSPTATPTVRSKAAIPCPAPCSGVPTVTVTDPGTTLGPVPISLVINEMVAKSASVVPVALTAGQLLYRCFEVADKTANGQVTTSVHEWWINPDTAEVVKILNDGSDMGGSGAPTDPPGFNAPTRQWLANLSTDPTILYGQLVQLNASVKLGGAHYVLKELGTLYRTSDPVLVPAVRAALYRVLGQISGISATEVAVAGRKLYRVHQAGQDVSDLLLDPATGLVAGARWDITNGQAGTVATIDLWRSAVVGQVGERA